MQLSTEAIIGIVALVLALPPALIIIWRWIRRSRIIQRASALSDAEMQLLPTRSWHALQSLPSYPSFLGAPERRHSEDQLDEFYYVAAMYKGSRSQHPEASSNMQQEADGRRKWGWGRWSKRPNC
ncbi:hypothetical protein V2A60_008036 [Cordyceps javanica]